MDGFNLCSRASHRRLEASQTSRINQSTRDTLPTDIGRCRVQLFAHLKQETTTVGKLIEFPSHRALALATKGARPRIARRIGVSNSRLNRQCQPMPSDEDPEAWGAKNLLESVGELFDATEAEKPGGSDYIMTFLLGRYINARIGVMNNLPPTAGGSVTAFPSRAEADETAADAVRLRRVA